MSLKRGTKVRVAHFGDEPNDGKFKYYENTKGNIYEVRLYMSDYVEIVGSTGVHSMFDWRIEPISVEHEAEEV